MITVFLQEEVMDKGKTRAFGNKQIIYVENDEPSYLYFIKKGKIKSYKRANDGRELSSTLYNDGDFLATKVYTEPQITPTMPLL